MKTLYVAIDPGHPSRFMPNGMPNYGAIAPGMVESYKTMDIARLLAAHCRHHNGVTPFLVRNKSDEVVSLDTRGIRADQAGCNFALIIHIDKWSNAKYRGATSYYSQFDTIGAGVSSQILRSMPEPLYTSGRQAIEASPNDGARWLEAPKAVLDPYRKRGIPASLIEVGFMSNPVDFDAMQRETVIDGVINAFMCGLDLAREMIN